MKRLFLALFIVVLFVAPVLAQSDNTIPTPDNTPMFVMAFILCVSLLGNLYQAVLAHRSVPPQFVSLVINTLKQVAEITPSKYDDAAVEVFEGLVNAPQKATPSVQTGVPAPTVVVNNITPAETKE